MKKQLLVFLVLTVCVTITRAQVYKREAGLRLGQTSGFSFRSIRDDAQALEVLLGFRDHGFQVCGFMEKIKPLWEGKHENFSLYYGPGLHIGYVRDDYDDFHNYPDDYPYDDTHSYFVFGVDAMLGIQYKLPDAAILLAADFKPFFEVQGFQKVKLNLWDFAFQIRYIF